MESLDRTFRPRIGWITLIFGIFTVAAALLFEFAISPVTITYPWLEDLAGWAFMGYLLIAAIGLAGLFLSRIRLACDGAEFVVTVTCGPTLWWRKSVKGRSWHAIATAGGSPAHGVEGEVRYRVEVATDDGGRTVVLGPLTCWIYGIHCL